MADKFIESEELPADKKDEFVVMFPRVISKDRSHFYQLTIYLNKTFIKLAYIPSVILGICEAAG